MVINIMVPQSNLHPELNLPVFKVKDPMSALTHFIGFLAAIVLTPLLVIKGSMDGRTTSELLSLLVFGLSMVLLYGASTSYHSFKLSTDRRNRILRKMDHMSIAVLVAGTYTPICLIALKDVGGKQLLAVVWTLAVLSIVFKAFWITCPKWVSSVIYLLMGWAVAPFLPAVSRALTPMGTKLLLCGGISYTIGAVVYIFKIPPKTYTGIGSHEIFHIFVLIGTLFHYIMIYSLIA